MADKSIVSNSKLTALGDAIRSKTGTTASLTIDAMASEIANISMGITPTGTLEITENGTQDVTNYASVNVNVASSGEDMLQARVDSNNSCDCLFYNYKGTNIDFISNLDTSNVTDMSYMFYSCSELTEIPELDTSNVTNMDNMFYYCTNLQTIPQLDTSKVTTMNSMFRGCKNLQTIPQLDTSNVTDMSYMFYNCSKLTTISKLDTSNATNVTSLFNGCYKLKSIPVIDLINVTGDYNANNMFSNCEVLTDITLKNIKVNLSVYSGSFPSAGPSLETLINTIMELWNYSDGSKSPKLTISNHFLPRIADTYVLVIDQTTDKMTAEVCDSTTEGAITLQAFAELKGWTLA